MPALLRGSLVGALTQSTGFPGVNNFNKDGKDQTLRRDVVQFTNANVIGDQVDLGTFKSTAMFDPLTTWCWFDAFGAGVTMNIGDATYPSGLASALNVASAGNAALWKGFSASKMSMPLWQALGYASDPGGTIQLLGTIAGANVSNTANFAWQFKGANR